MYTHGLAINQQVHRLKHVLKYVQTLVNAAFKAEVLSCLKYFIIFLDLRR